MNKTRISWAEYIFKGFKTCNKCGQLLPLSLFDMDRSHKDLHTTICKQCKYKPTTDRIGKRIRREMRKKGFHHCRMCEKWLLLENFYRAHGYYKNICKSCSRVYARLRYAENISYRTERRLHAHARKRMTVKPDPKVVKTIFALTDGKCVYCGSPANTLDHVVPLSRGGDSEMGNLVPCCISCNSRKKAKSVFEFIDAKVFALPDVFEDIISVALANGRDLILYE